MTSTRDLEQTVKEIVANHAHLDGPLLPILQAVQDRCGYIPEDAIPVVALALNLSRAEVYGVVSFYHDFRKEPAGRHHIKLCRAEACQAVGGRELCASVLKHFGIDWGETTADGRVTVSPIYCLGLCSVAPAALVDDTLLGRIDADSLIAKLELPK